PVEALEVRSLDNILIAVLEPGLVELGLSSEEIFGEEISAGEIEESWVPDSEAELMDIMDEFKIPDYKQELDEGELDISILSESESEEAWSTMLKEVRRIESEEGRKIPLTKEDWIERIPSEIKSIFFEEELRELDVSELEHLTQITPTEVQEIVDSIAVNEEMYTLEPEASASAISAALCERIDSDTGEELDEAEAKERLFQLLPVFVKEFFSTTWLDKLSCAEIEELLTIPEDDLKIVVQSLKESRDTAEETENEPTGGTEDELEHEVEFVAEPEAESEIEPESELEIEDEAKPTIVTQDDLKAELIAELKTEIESEPEVVVGESIIEYDDLRMTALVEKFGEEKANLLITIPEASLEGIPEDQIKEMDMELLEGLKQALESEILEDDGSEETSEVEEISDAETEPAVEPELKNDLMAELEIEPDAEAEPEAEDEPEE
ncbi:MAG: hypothetical protein ACTSYJ_07820, partial [Candidatus Thorarchaeota archaeon]